MSEANFTTITINLSDADLAVLDSRRASRSRQGWIRAAIHTATMSAEPVLLPGRPAEPVQPTARYVP